MDIVNIVFYLDQSLTGDPDFTNMIESEIRRRVTQGFNLIYWTLAHDKEYSELRGAERNKKVLTLLKRNNPT